MDACIRARGGILLPSPLGIQRGNGSRRVGLYRNSHLVCDVTRRGLWGGNVDGIGLLAPSGCE